VQLSDAGNGAIGVTIIIPAFNEARTILTLLQRVAKQNVDGISFDVLVVDDGSTDETVAILEANPQMYGQLIKLETNRGKGGAVIAGLKAAKGDYVLFQDADLEYDPADYGRLLVPIIRYGADIVMGSRLIAPELTRVHYFWNKVGNRMITLLFNLLHNTTFTDIYSCYLCLRRELVEPQSLVSNGWGQQAEILSKATQRARVIYEAPISYHGRTYAEGKKIRARHVIDVIVMMIRSRLGT
jgi:glycosyltransferase involved in cell wall biosynthesis